MIIGTRLRTPHAAAPRLGEVCAAMCLGMCCVCGAGCALCGALYVCVSLLCVRSPFAAAGADPLRFDFVDTLMNACRPDVPGASSHCSFLLSPLSSLAPLISLPLSTLLLSPLYLLSSPLFCILSSGTGSAHTVPISAEDLSALISSAQPYTAMDAPAMFTVARDLLRRLTEGQLSISSRDAGEARSALARGREHEQQLADDVESLRKALTVRALLLIRFSICCPLPGGVTVSNSSALSPPGCLQAKIRRLEGRLDDARDQSSRTAEDLAALRDT